MTRLRTTQKQTREGVSPPGNIQQYKRDMGASECVFAYLDIPI